MNLKFLKISNLFKKEGIELKNLLFGEIKTADGAFTLTFQGDDIVVGEPIFVITDEGEMPAPDGTHLLEDGRSVIVEGGLGVVSEIVLAEEVPAEDAPAEEVVVEETPLKKDDVSTPLSKEEITRSIQETVRKFEDDYTAKVDSLTAKFETELAKYDEVITGLHSIYVAMSEKSNVKPAQTPRAFNSEKKRVDDMWKKINKRK